MSVVGIEVTKSKGLYILGRCARTMSCAHPPKKWYLPMMVTCHTTITPTATTATSHNNHQTDTTIQQWVAQTIQLALSGSLVCFFYNTITYLFID